jgi:hypothetical protein
VRDPENAVAADSGVAAAGSGGVREQSLSSPEPRVREPELEEEELWRERGRDQGLIGPLEPLALVSVSELGSGEKKEEEESELEEGG